MWLFRSGIRPNSIFSLPALVIWTFPTATEFLPLTLPPTISSELCPRHQVQWSTSTSLMRTLHLPRIHFKSNCKLWSSFPSKTPNPLRYYRLLNRHVNPSQCHYRSHHQFQCTKGIWCAAQRIWWNRAIGKPNQGQSKHFFPRKNVWHHPQALWGTTQGQCEFKTGLIVNLNHDSKFCRRRKMWPIIMKETWSHCFIVCYFTKLRWHKVRALSGLWLLPFLSCGNRWPWNELQKVFSPSTAYPPETTAKLSQRSFSNANGRFSHWRESFTYQSKLNCNPFIPLL